MKIKSLIVASIIAAISLIYGCGGASTVTPDFQDVSLQGIGTQPTVYNFGYMVTPDSATPILGRNPQEDNTGGQFYLVGTFSVTIEEFGMSMDMELVDEWYMDEIKIDVVNDPKEFPMTKKGNPIPGHFDLKEQLHPPAQLWNSHYALTDFAPGDEFFIAAHSEVMRMEDNQFVQHESAWVGDIPFPGKNWATYFSFVVPDPHD
jgi:hypothetical protein